MFVHGIYGFGMYVLPMNGHPSFGSSYDIVPMNVPSYYQ